jgi:predicted transcriptional regulator
MAADTATVRRGLLAFTKKKGGKIPMRELHTHSLLMFQVSHQAFSQVMEGLVADGHVRYDAAEGAFELTPDGERWLAEHAASS